MQRTFILCAAKLAGERELETRNDHVENIKHSCAVAKKQKITIFCSPFSLHKHMCINS